MAELLNESKLDAVILIVMTGTGGPAASLARPGDPLLRFGEGTDVHVSEVRRRET
jgi:hypothetical protein